MDKTMTVLSCILSFYYILFLSVFLDKLFVTINEIPITFWSDTIFIFHVIAKSYISLKDNVRI
jgi:hypothetical protein